MACKKWLPLSDSMVLVGKSKCTWQVVDIDPMSLPNVNDMNVCEALDDCQTIKNLKSKDVNLQHQIDQLVIEKNKLIEKDNDLQNQIDENNARDDSQDSIITQINTEISSLKTDYITVINKLNSLWVNVILDEDYTNFEEWIENVYVPACWLAENEFSEWDWYINSNPSLDSENWVYVNIRDKDSTEPCSINDWYKLPYDIPELAIIGIDPIKVVHPYKWRFEVSIDQDKLADFISKLDHLDLSTVKLYLGDVYLDWVIKESLHIQEDLTVDNNTNTQNLNVSKNANIQNLYAEEWCIKVHKCDEKFLWDVNIEWDINAINAHYDGNVNVDWWVNVEWHTETDTIHAREWCIEKFTCDTDHTWYNIINWDTVINNSTTNTPTVLTQHIHVTQDAHFDWNIVINSNSFNLTDPDTWETVCMQNLAKNAFTPSYWFFTLEWSWVLSEWRTSSSVVWLWSDWVLRFHDSQRDIDRNSVYVWKQWTNIVWDEENATSWVWMDPVTKFITINWSNPDYAWVYQISMQMVIRFAKEDQTWYKNIYAHRAWFVVYNSALTNRKIYDDKHATWDDDWTYKHSHSYTDYACECWSTTRTTSENSMRSFRIWNDNQWYSDFHPNSDDHYTYTVNVTIPINEDMLLAPYLKVSSWVEWMPVVWKFEIMNWQWVSWWNAALSVVKIANVWKPVDIHCEWN